MNLQSITDAIKAKLKAIATFLDKEIAAAATEALSITQKVKAFIASPTGEEIEAVIASFIPSGVAYEAEATKIIDSALPMLQTAQAFGDNDGINRLLAGLGQELTMLINPKAIPSSFQYHAFDAVKTAA